VFSTVLGVLSQGNTRLRLLHKLNDIDLISHVQKDKTVSFHVLNSDKPWVFDQLECAQGPIYIIILHIGFISKEIPLNLTIKRLRQCKTKLKTILV